MEKVPGLEGDCQTSINTTCQNIVRIITEKYNQEMTIELEKQPNCQIFYQVFEVI